MRINECFAEECKYNEDGKCVYDKGIDIDEDGKCVYDKGIDIDEDGQCLMYESEE